MSTKPQTTQGRPGSPGRRWVAGGAAGLLAGLAAVAASEAVAALVDGVTSPLLAVGNRAVDATPRPLKELAIERFGEHDKPVLIGGVVATVAVLALLVGVVGVRRPRVALGAFLVLSLVATVASLTDRSATASPVLRLLPALALVVVGVAALLVLLRTLRTPATPRAQGPPRRAPRDVQGPQPASSVEDGKPRLLVGDLLPAHVEGDRLPAAFDRRAFLQTAVAVGAVAAAGGVVRQTFGGSAAAAQRADLTIPKPATSAPALASGTSLDVPGISPFLTSNKDFYRVDTALRVPDVPIDGYTLRIHGMVDQELDALLRGPARAHDDREAHHPHLRLQPGRRQVRRQRHLDRRSRSATSSRRPASGTVPTRSSRPAPTT